MIHEKRDLLNKAKEAIASGSDENLRYACLDLRSCIELACYEKYRLYIDEIPPEYLKAWQPRQILKYLKDIDPLVDANQTVVVANNDANGNPVLPGSVVVRHNAITLSFIKETYDKIGSFIHVPVLPDQRYAQLKKFRQGELRQYLQDKVIPIIEKLCESTGDANITTRITFKCTECENNFSRSKRSLDYYRAATCSYCGAEYSFSYEDGKGSLVIKTMRWKCIDCQHVNVVMSYVVNEGGGVSCERCQSKFVFIKKPWGLERKP